MVVACGHGELMPWARRTEYGVRGVKTAPVGILQERGEAALLIAAAWNRTFWKLGPWPGDGPACHGIAEEMVPHRGSYIRFRLSNYIVLYVEVANSYGVIR